MHSNKTGLFLMELIISILFFALAATVCIQLFVKAHQLSNASIATDHALTQCENLATLFEAKEDVDIMSTILADYQHFHIETADAPSFQENEPAVKASCKIVFYDKDWQPITNQDTSAAKYRILYAVSDTSVGGESDNIPGIVSFHAEAQSYEKDSWDELYHLHFDHYVNH